MARDLNFTYDLYFPPDGKWGAIDRDTGEYNGMIRGMIDKQADLIVAATSINSIREAAIDFSTPYIYLARGIIMRSSQGQQIDYFRFLKPFTMEIWLAIMASIVFVGLMVSLINKLSPYDYYGHLVLSSYRDPKTEETMEKFRRYTYMRYCRQSRETLNWHNALWYSLAAVFEEGGHGSPESVSGRVVLVGWWLAVLALITTYTAIVTSWLTKARLVGDIETMADLVNSDYAYGILQAGGAFSLLKLHGVSLYRNSLKTMEMNGWLVPSEAAGLHKACTQRFAFLAPLPSLIAAKQDMPHCNFRIPKERWGRVGYGVGVPKGQEEIRKVITDYILKLFEMGKMDELLNKWVQFDKASSEKSKVDTGQMKAGNVLGVFIIIIISMIVGVLFLLLERCVGAAKKKSRQSERQQMKYKAEILDMTQMNNFS